eukprot:jgi/Astpho2/6766/Aster-07212
MLPPQGTAASAQQESAYRAYLQAHEAIDSMNSPEPLRRVHGGPAEGIKPAQAQQAPDSLGSTGTLEDSDDEPISDVEFTPAAKAVTRRRRHVVGRSASTRRRRKAAAGAGTRAKALSAQARANRPKKAGEFSSTYKGVTKHKDTGKYEAHLWDNKVIRTGQLDANGRRKGKQVYLGSFKCEKLAARVYDIAARVFLGPNTFLNFDAADYEDINKELAGISKHDLAVLLKKNCHTFTWPCKLQDLDA